MEIAAPCVVSLVWRLEDTQGQLIDELTDALEFLVGGEDLLPAVEAALVGQETGFRTRIQLEPEQAFGDYDASLVFFEERKLFAGHLEPGMQFDGPPEGATTPGLERQRIYTVTEVYDSHVVFDGNHPLAGIALRLDLQVRGVRAATEDEIAQGSVGEPALTVLSTAPASDRLH